LLEALGRAVRAWPVRLAGQMAGAVTGEQLAQRAVAEVAEGVVCHQSLRGDAVRGVEGERALDEAGHRCRFLVLLELDEGEP
jgi:hypothetical protein